MLLLRERRRWRRDLIHFFEGVSLHIHSGYDLAYSWSEVLKGLSEVLNPTFTELLCLRDEEGITGLLGRLANGYPEPSHRMWFGMLKQLYGQGAPMGEAVLAAGKTLRGEQERDLEAHCRRLSGRLNLRILFFFLPPTFLLLFCPLLREWGIE